MAIPPKLSFNYVTVSLSVDDLQIASKNPAFLRIFWELFVVVFEVNVDFKGKIDKKMVYT